MQNAGATPIALDEVLLEERLRAARQRHEQLKKADELRRLEAEIARIERSSSEESEPSVRSAGASQELRPSELQPEKLPEFHGKNVREHREWCQRAENAFRLAPRRFRDDEIKIAWTAQSLRGTPQMSWNNAVETQEGYTWEQYKTFLLDLIEDPANRELDAAQLYEDAKQRPGQTAQQFKQYLITLEGQLDEPYTTAQRRRHYWTKLLPELREQIINYQDIPTTLDGIVSLATRIEIQRKRAATAGKNQDLSHKERKDKRQRNRSPRINQQRSDAGAKANTPGSSTPNPGNCFNCGKPGH